MRVITVTEPGGPENLVIAEAPQPQPGPGEVRVAVTAAGVNRADLLQRRGFYPPPPGITDVLGLEVSGVVDAVASDVTTLRVGDPVVALLAGGGYAEAVVVPAGQCAPVPDGVDPVTAAGLIEVAATVVSNARHVSLAAGENFLVHGGSGGIGSFAIPYAHALGCRVFTTVGSADKAEYCRTIGADVAVDYHDDDWASLVKDAAGERGIDVILDIIGAKYLEANISLLARGGRLVVIGLQGGRKGTLDLNRLLSRAATVTATSLRFRPLEEKAAIVAEVVADVWPLVSAGTIPLAPTTTYPLAEAAEAHRRLESGANTGKIVLTVS
ncbi:MAG: NAD(P)H-quinone oxidoreductase [Propionibacteriaceae bacterium]|jgi:putative PIG3 family NAD(P)H quinone oxidoreductase|nr:NAD(P)H-quinone oxidoreductase [Propionibacteriaceae bacterium]